jgi:hypothetical protein
LVGLAGYNSNPVLREYLGRHLRTQSPKPVRSVAQPYRLRQRLTAQQQAELVTAYLAGSTAQAMALEYQVSKTAVLKLLHRAGAQVRRPRVSQDETDKIIALFKQGLTQAEIARQMNRDPGGIWHVLQRAGLVGKR